MLRTRRVLRERERVQGLHPRVGPASLRLQVRHAPHKVQLLDLLAAHQGRDHAASVSAVHDILISYQPIN